MNYFKKMKHLKKTFSNLTIINSRKKLEEKKNQNKEKKYSQYNILLVNLNIFILFSISVGYYHRSLIGCKLPENECLKKLGYNFFIGLFLDALKSGIIIITILFLIFHKFISYINLFYIIPTYIFLFYNNQGSDLNHHGTYNMLGYTAIILIGLFIIEYFYRIYYFIKNKNRKILIFMILISIFFVFFILYSDKEGCKNWNKGLGEESIINDEYSDSCYISTPKKCRIKLFKGLLDINYFFPKCSSSKSERTYLNKFINKKYIQSNILSYPITTNFKFPEDFILPRIQTLILEKMDNNTEDKEIILSFDKKSKGRITINIKANETLIKEREEKRKNKKTKFDNILLIYIDSISRVEFYRSLPRTASLLNSIYFKNTNNKKNYSSFQFFKYHSMAAWTCINVDPMFYGRNYYKRYGDESIVKYLKEKGFITAQTINMCTKEFYDFEVEDKNLPFVQYDHENYALFCDPNTFEPNNYFGPFKGPYSFRKRCLYGKDTFEYIFDYGKKFLNAYKDQRKFIRMGFIDAHEGSMEVVKYLDNHLYEFLIYYLDYYMNDKNVIFFLSDHGNNMLGIYNALGFEDFFREKTLGFLFLILPIFEKNKNNEIFNLTSLIYNQQKFTTPYDIYYTMRDMIDGNNYLDETKHSLFLEIDGLKRNCYTYNDIRNTTCSCFNYTENI